MNKRIAIPVENGQLCEHFGHCEQFYFADIENGKIVKEQSVTPPEHQPGVYPAWVRRQGAKAVIAGGMGAKAKELFAREGIAIYAGEGITDPQKLVESYIVGGLSLLQGNCNHDHQHHDCDHE